MRCLVRQVLRQYDVVEGTTDEEKESDEGRKKEKEKIDWQGDPMADFVKKDIFIGFVGLKEDVGDFLKQPGEQV